MYTCASCTVRACRSGDKDNLPKNCPIREEDLVAAAYRYSRQVENSDENLERLEHLLADSPLYSLSSMLTVLCGGKGKGSGDI